MSSATPLTMDIEAGAIEVSAKSTMATSSRRYGLAAAVLGAAALALGAVAMVCSQQLNSSTELSFSRSLWANNDVKFGVTADSLDIDQLENEIGAEIDVIMKYQSINNLAGEGNKYLDIMDNVLNEKEGVLVLEFKGATLGDINSGNYDDKMRKIARDVANDGRPVWLRPLHEFNGDWYPWGTYTNGQSPGEFVQAYKRIVDTFRREGANNAKWQLGYNNRSPHEDMTPFSSWYPGDSYVDLICASAYSWDGKKSFEQVFAEAYDRMSALPGNKPLGWCEGSTIGTGEQKGEWFRSAAEAIRSRFTKVKQAIYFLNNKDDGNFSVNGGSAGLGAAIRGDGGV